MKKVTMKQAEEIRALKEMREDEIDTSGTPEITPITPAVVGKFSRPIKKSITVRLDADLIAWLKSGGRGYQTRANKMLRSLMEKQQSQARKKQG